MKNNTHKYKITMRVIGILSCLFVFTGYAIPIKIQVNGQGFINCEYSLLQFMNGQTPELNITTNSIGETCAVMGPDEVVTAPGIPTPIYPKNVLQDANGAPVKRVSEIKWKMVDGATRYSVIAFTGTAPYNPTTSNVIYNRTLNSAGGTAAQQASFAAACGGVSVGGNCAIAGPIFFGGTIQSRDLPDGSYQWQVRVHTAEPPGAPTDFSDATASFIINVEVSTAATESPVTFADAWVNQNYDSSTGANDFATKAQLRNMLDTAPYNSYQEIVGNKKIYIVNNSINPETVIPSCVNGKNGGLSNRNCTIDMPFELDDIYALRLKTRADGVSGYLNKASNQLINYEGALYNVVLSKYPGRMVANQGDDFQGRCAATSINYNGDFSLYTKPNGDASTFCIVPADTQLYANVELASDQTQCTASPGPSGYVCQIDILIGSFANN